MYDLEDNEVLSLEEGTLLDGNNCKKCVGCFKCWTDGKNCVIKDNYYNNGEKLLESDELIIISKCIYGCYSSKVKRMLERSISYVEPYFTLRNREIHHKSKTNKKLTLSVYFYGNNISFDEKNIAKKLIERNKLNLNIIDSHIYFYDDYKEIKL